MNAQLSPTLQPVSSPCEAIAVAHGDGIGPEIMDAVLHVLRHAAPALRLQPVAMGHAAYLDGHSTGILPQTWDVLAEHPVLLKGPMTTPQGGGYKSINVTLRKTLGLYANVRPCVAYHPYVASPHPGMDVVIIRENEEDTYGGIEHRQTDEVVQCLKLITRPGCERIVRYAFEYAVAHRRGKVTCMTKDNIMKMTDGLFHRVFDEIAAEYPQIQAEHRIIDIGAARLATRPRDFDVIVTPNLYGDIISDIAAEIAGSIGLAPSANIGLHGAMFEAVHGSAPDIADKNIANPSGLLLASVQMLLHIGQANAAQAIHNAWLRTIEDGLHTHDLFNERTSRRRVGTREFAHAVIERLGQQPQHLPKVAYDGAPASATSTRAPAPVRARADKQLEGVDVFLDWNGQPRDPDELARRLQAATPAGFRLAVITNRGVKVWPNGHPDTFCTDHWRCRFKATQGWLDACRVPELLGRLVEQGFEAVKTENLYRFGDQAGYSAAQGE
ncbi:MAG: NADP-dependent isocitrate dehydrogenase [Rhodanobacteraceae bacterium]|jgi:isocitrate dehydrogenase|nr:NADP-dependent isocitrate dehydrogenase [Rhodanobacteraceae bacterium]